MAFREALEEKKEQIVSRWLEAALSLYQRDASSLYARQKDRFANPVGHSLREGTLAIFEALVEDTDAEKIRQHLLEIIKIRAVQQFLASESLRFILTLKDIVREETKDVLHNERDSQQCLDFERKIDRVVLTAFDVYAECREQVFEIRTKEMKRSVSWVVDKLNERDGGSVAIGNEEIEEGPRA